MQTVEIEQLMKDYDGKDERVLKLIEDYLLIKQFLRAELDRAQAEYDFHQ